MSMHWHSMPDPGSGPGPLAAHSGQPRLSSQPDSHGRGESLSAVAANGRDNRGRPIALMIFQIFNGNDISNNNINDILNSDF